MIKAIELENFGPLRKLEWSGLGQINLVIGNNGSGKTFLLKALYTAMRTLEEYKRGNDKRIVSEILADKLYWTFQPDQAIQFFFQQKKFSLYINRFFIPENRKKFSDSMIPTMIWLKLSEYHLKGVKKISILETLLSNRYLDNNSIIFIDEPESALHPEAISHFLDIIALLAGMGIQFFMASHSYFVVKKLFLISQVKKMSIPLIASEGSQDWTSTNLLDSMPSNSIIDESIRLYREETGLAFK